MSNFKYQDRIAKLSEILFNLHSINGFRKRMELAKKEDLESFVAEIEAGKLLFLSENPYEFNIPSGKKGKDYDFNVSFDNKPVYCEVKCKSEDNKLNIEGLIDTIESAKKQLPKDDTNLVFIKLPEKWVYLPDIKLNVSNVIKAILRNTNRILAVVFYWEEWIKVPKGRYINSLKYYEIKNTKFTILHPNKQNILKKYNECNWDNWVNYHKIIDEVNPEIQ